MEYVVKGIVGPYPFPCRKQRRGSTSDDLHLRSRFLTEAVMACLDEVAFGEPERVEQPQGGTPAVDVAGRLRGMWA